MAKKQRNHRATLDVTPTQLPMITALMPPGYFIAGSETMIGVVRLILEGASVDQDGQHLQIVETAGGNERKVSFDPSPLKPPSNA